MDSMCLSPVPRRVLSPSRGGVNARNGLAHVMRHLLQLPGDDPQLVRLAAVAVLVGREGRGRCGGSAAGWSTEEMDIQRSEVRKLEAAWRSFMQASGSRDMERAAGAAALHAAFKIMEEAVQRGTIIPYGDELIIGVASAFLGASFETRLDVEVAVGAMFTNAVGSMASVAEDVMASAVSRSAGNSPINGQPLLNGGASSAASIIQAMLSSDPTPAAAMRESSLPRSVLMTM
mmetsp:Transcript_99761/g.157910  ORF Transcript_99761/g.157910 Transcript_99761/m.157910 type:complete len:232 (+) Transcript_99761:1-696(+)|eukprot:CAMPEP_0169061404 /NCGR_PEP_ID=MMETSP1015-20121227/93_1 /TAXON_ID=342587 /ORGANISM="Karlodinium micrum, Strain CCMP2283" /LENGTH=231 /DNA_ID=CAMNT_0009119391 /DNA_START=1 /DNA_END=696 /DNA_ORIENTATION=-